ncbi:MAG: hypothetical protein DMF84_30665 [Acidobacteria bacterium]|nr:MAG: hypothetical protein DMF84_30665 [Acidobacteriota bacterium]
MNATARSASTALVPVAESGLAASGLSDARPHASPAGNPEALITHLASSTGIVWDNRVRDATFK